MSSPPGVAVAGNGVSDTVKVALPPSATVSPPAMVKVNDTSSSSMVPVAVAVPKMAEDDGPLRVTVKVSVDSLAVSSIRAMAICAEVVPGLNLTVLLPAVGAVKSVPAAAVPLPVA